MRPEIVAFNLTDRCNLRCRHCYNDSGGGAGRDLPPGELLRIAGEIARLEPAGVCLCGGEPLLSPVLFEVIACLRPHVGSLSMVSNGWLMDRDMAEKIAACGVDNVQISLDGAEPWQHDSLRGAAGSFERACRAVRYLRQSGLPQVAVSLIPNPLNIRCLEQYFSLCIFLGAQLIRCMPLLPLGRGAGVALTPSSEEMFRFCRDFCRCREAYAREIRAEWDNPVGSVRYLYRLGALRRRPFALTVNSDGTVLLDLYLSFAAGNLREMSLESIWREQIPAAWQRQEVRECVERLEQVQDFSEMSFSWRGKP